MRIDTNNTLYHVPLASEEKPAAVTPVIGRACPDSCTQCNSSDNIRSLDFQWCWHNTEIIGCMSMKIWNPFLHGQDFPVSFACIVNSKVHVAQSIVFVRHSAGKPLQYLIHFHSTCQTWQQCTIIHVAGWEYPGLASFPSLLTRLPGLQSWKRRERIAMFLHVGMPPTCCRHGNKARHKYTYNLWTFSSTC